MDTNDPGRTAQLELMIGARMRTRRRQLGLSQSDLAERLGVSFQQVQKYERGANRVAASTLLAAAQALGTSISWLVGEEVSGRDDDEDVFRALARPGALEMLQAFNAIPDPAARAALLALAREMAAGPADRKAPLDRPLRRSPVIEGGCADLPHEPGHAARTPSRRAPAAPRADQRRAAGLAQPRVPHAAERGAGHVAPAGEHPAHRRAARLRRRHPRFRRTPADPGQRRAGLRQAGRRQGRPAPGRRRGRGPAARRLRTAVAAGAGKGRRDRLGRARPAWARSAPTKGACARSCSISPATP